MIFETLAFLAPVREAYPSPNAEPYGSVSLEPRFRRPLRLHGELFSC